VSQSPIGTNKTMLYLN